MKCSKFNEVKCVVFQLKVTHFEYMKHGQQEGVLADESQQMP